MLRLSEGMKLAKYALVGGLNTGVDFAVFCALVYGAGLGSLWAQSISYLAGVINSYLLNRYWTFKVKKKQSVGEVVRFILINIVSFSAATLALLGLEHWGTESALAKIVSVVCSLAVNYIGYRLWVFRDVELQGDRAN
ncbi:GtrA family protein [Cohnella abietis]|uniref:Putative membrane protein YngA n=1 Tax=Cohnella abietis TaxID=2507935 RepID=A0A3T1DAH7_9BACL|nr:GtrA family protein [Cohnella abietis]BBI35085.1 putative membrane protein YngA [Cohnella abietis]